MRRQVCSHAREAGASPRRTSGCCAARRTSTRRSATACSSPRAAAANKSKVWFATSVLLAALCGRRGRRAARRGVLAIALTSTIVNAPLKLSAASRTSAAEPHGATPQSAAHAHLVLVPVRARGFGVRVRDVRRRRSSRRRRCPPSSRPGRSRTRGCTSACTFLPTSASAPVWASPRRSSRDEFSARVSRCTCPIRRNGEALPRRVVLLSSLDAGDRGRAGRGAATSCARCGVEIVAEIPVDESERLRAVRRARTTVHCSSPRAATAPSAPQRTGSPAPALCSASCRSGRPTMSHGRSASRSTRELRPRRWRGASRARSTPADSPSPAAGRATSCTPRPSASTCGSRSSRRNRRSAAGSDGSPMRWRRRAHCATTSRSSANCATASTVERLTLAQLSIINAPVFGGSLDLRVPDARVDSRRLVVIALEQKPLWELLVGDRPHDRRPTAATRAACTCVRLPEPAGARGATAGRRAGRRDHGNAAGGLRGRADALRDRSRRSIPTSEPDSALTRPQRAPSDGTGCGRCSAR